MAGWKGEKEGTEMEHTTLKCSAKRVGPDVSYQTPQKGKVFWACRGKKGGSLRGQRRGRSTWTIPSYGTCQEEILHSPQGKSPIQYGGKRRQPGFNLQVTRGLRIFRPFCPSKRPAKKRGGQEKGVTNGGKKRRKGGGVKAGPV